MMNSVPRRQVHRKRMADNYGTPAGFGLEVNHIVAW